MIQLKKFIFCLGVFLFAQKAWAAGIDEDEAVISLFGKACETIKQGEAKSSVRLRATDKASFKSVENIAELSEYRNQMPTHDFNVLIYAIVDNYIEDLSVKTSKQTEQEICVEATGFLHSENILKAINENYQKFSETPETITHTEATYPQALEIEDEKAIVPTVTDFPPAPSLPEKVESTEQVFDTPTTVSVPQKSENKLLGNGTTVFIEKTKFFNGMTTNAYFDDLRQIIQKKQGIRIVEDKNLADYIISPEVLRAKVDAVNSQTNRLQMVVALELFDVKKETSVTEHQNRFILFEGQEDEQNVASNLMKKLFAQAGKIIVNKISTKTVGAVMERDAIITPAGAEKVSPPRRP